MNIKAKGSFPDTAGEKDKYETIKRERQEHVDKVVQSPSRKKIVVAGPGTGKTYLFKTILEGKENTLTLTFVNALVEDLSLELCGVSDVRTLHSFARSVLKKVTQESIKIFPKVPQVIQEDARVLLNENIDFECLFDNRDDGNKHLQFYKNRKNYYGHYGFSEIVFEAVKHFENDDDAIPVYEQVVVDEFQDFNALEVSLIDLLAKKSPVLIVGDDDQALYESLRSASAKHIRQRCCDSTCGYEAFSLPYCSRCTRVIVEAVNDIITGATQNGYLSGRSSKPFTYFHDETKDRDSDKNPQLIYTQRFATQIPWFIQQRIEDIAKQVRDKFSVLIISPTKTQCKATVDALQKKGFQSVHFMEKKGKEDPTLLDGLKLLLQAKRECNRCNLGWRIAAKAILNDADFETVLKLADKEAGKSFSELIQPDKKREVTQMLTTLRAVRDGKRPDDAKLAELLKKVDLDAYEMATDCLKDEIRSGLWPDSNPGIRKTPITVTTIQSSKGLAADYVFITYFDDRYFIKHEDKISDQEICNFLVALTRARRGVFLISSDTKRTPVFLKWIDESRIEKM